MKNRAENKIPDYRALLFSASIFAGIISLFFGLGEVSAATTVLQPISGGSSGGTVTDPGAYIKNLYTIGVGIAGVLAVIMIIIGGIEFITSAANPSGRTDARKRIWAAVGGLLIALLSYIILNTINPNLVKFDISIGGTGGGAPSSASGGGGGTLTGGSPPLASSGAGSGLSDEVVRAELAKNNVKWNNDCVNGNTGTCFNGLHPTLINEMTSLQENIGCADPTACKSYVIATGATEIYDSSGKLVHSTDGQYTHKNGYKVDIDDTPEVTNHVLTKFIDLKKTRSDGAALYRNPETGAIYAREDNHWDIVNFDSLYVDVGNPGAGNTNDISVIEINKNTLCSDIGLCE